MDDAVPAGRLTLDRFGYAQPVDSPLYQPGRRGWAYRSSFFAGVMYETDGEAFLDVLPAGLTPTHWPPRVFIWGIECRTAGLGDFNEMKIELLVDLDGEPHVYCPYIMVSALEGALAPDAAMAVGRELIGAPKKIALIRFNRDAGQICVTLERPIGKRLVTLSVAPKEQLTPAELGRDTALPNLYLRVIPGIEGPRPDIAQLVRFEIPIRCSATESFAGPGTVVFESPSAEDPWFRLAPVNLLGGLAARFDLDIPPTATVVRDYLAAEVPEPPPLAAALAGTAPALRKEQHDVRLA
jgi:acetoacetate decarboxylase